MVQNWWTDAWNVQFFKTVTSDSTRNIQYSIFSGVLTVRTRLQLKASTIHTVSPTLAITIAVHYIPYTAAPSLQPNFVRLFREISDQLSLFQEKSQSFSSLNRFIEFSGDADTIFGHRIEWQKYCQIRNTWWFKLKPLDGPPDIMENNKSISMHN